MILTRLVRRAWREVIYWRFCLLERPRLRKPVLEEICGLHLLILPDVFNPRIFFSGEFLGSALDSELIPRGSRVLDVGTGSGIGAICSTRRAASVVAVDRNPTAVHCAHINVRLNHVEDKVEVHCGDLFSPVTGQRFDVILFNPPYLCGRPKTPLEEAFLSEGIAERFAASLVDYLEPDGWALLVLSSIGEEARFLDSLRSQGFESEVVREQKRWLEFFRIYRVRLPPDQRIG